MKEEKLLKGEQNEERQQKTRKKKGNDGRRAKY